jgi:hypothetical protein
MPREASDCLTISDVTSQLSSHCKDAARGQSVGFRGRLLKASGARCPVVRR